MVGIHPGRGSLSLGTVRWPDPPRGPQLELEFADPLSREPSARSEEAPEPRLGTGKRAGRSGTGSPADLSGYLAAAGCPD